MGDELVGGGGLTTALELVLEVSSVHVYMLCPKSWQKSHDSEKSGYVICMCGIEVCWIVKTS